MRWTRWAGWTPDGVSQAGSRGSALLLFPFSLRGDGVRVELRHDGLVLREGRFQVRVLRGFCPGGERGIRPLGFLLERLHVRLVEFVAGELPQLTQILFLGRALGGW